MSGTEKTSMVGHFARHLVGIAGIQRQKEGEIGHPFFIAGVVIELLGEWFFVTAGHCLKALDQAIDSSLISGLSLIDFAGTQAAYRMPIPFVYQDALHHASEYEFGADFGFVHLSSYYRRLLAQNDITAHDAVQWKRQPASFEVAHMLGFPEASISADGEATVTFATTMIPVDILDSEPEEFARLSPASLSDEERAVQRGLFYGHIPDEVALPMTPDGVETIKGMSGGPIFGFASIDGRMKYWIAAIQSCWLPQRRLIRATPFPPICNTIEKTFAFIRSLPQ